jgi:hypothetical protein
MTALRTPVGKTIVYLGTLFGAIAAIGAGWAYIGPILRSDSPPLAGVARVEPLEELPEQVTSMNQTLLRMERGRAREAMNTNLRRMCQAREAGEDESEWRRNFDDAQEDYMAANRGVPYPIIVDC